MVNKPSRERAERRKMAPFIEVLRETGCRLIAVDRSMRSLARDGTFGPLGYQIRKRMTLKVPDLLADAGHALIWFEYDEFCHSRARSAYGHRSEKSRMTEIHSNLRALTGKPCVLVRYGADPAVYSRQGLKCADNPPLTRGKRIELARKALRLLCSGELVPGDPATLSLLYLAYAPSAISIVSGHPQVHLRKLSEGGLMRFAGRLCTRLGWRPKRLAKDNELREEDPQDHCPVVDHRRCMPSHGQVPCPLQGTQSRL